MSESIIKTSQICAFVPTRDFAKAKAFYVGVLDLPIISEDGFALSLNANGIMLRITAVPELTPHPFTTLGWQVDHIELAVTDLMSRGVEFEKYPFIPSKAEGIMTFPNGDKVAWFKDPDGNLLSIAQHV